VTEGKFEKNSQNVSLFASLARLLECDNPKRRKGHTMNSSKFLTLIAAACAALAVVYAMRPSYDELTANNRALAVELRATSPQLNDAPQSHACFDASLRAISCNDALIAEAATGHVEP
jgi:cytochrome c-type biogenesis protein CcmH/NrfG